MSKERKKAEALVEMFYKNAIEEYQADLLEKQDWLKKRIKKRCIEYAKLCVIEILSAVTTIADKKYDFYNSVLTELNKM